MEIFQQYELGERCLLVNLHFSKAQELNAELDELYGLIAAVDWQAVTVIEGKRNIPDAKFFCGSGKLDEIKTTIADNEIDLVVFNHPISPSQERNLEKTLELKVIDRTRLILEIFSARAKTHEGKLQVELAQLNYAATRLVKGWSHLERQKGGIGVRGGPGETQLELDRRMLRTRIAQIEKKLDRVKKQRQLSRLSRQKRNIPTVAFVGYTNAGKSTLFNHISRADVLAKDQLFATLDPTLRRVTIPRVGEVIFSDTVGFIRNLPHDLVQAFHATLEEAIQADVLIHVIDYADEQYHAYIEQVNKVLIEIGAGDKPVIAVYNKIDRLDAIDAHVVYHQDRPADVYLSALKGAGIRLMYEALAQFFNHSWLKGVLNLPPQYAAIRAELYALGVVDREQIADDGGYLLSLNIAENDLNDLSRQNRLELMAFFSQD
ncbi:MAG: ribosome rescue GTPase HflX [Francisellaceae bacterium]